MHIPINVKSPNNISEWQKGFNSAFKGLNTVHSFSYITLGCIYMQLCTGLGLVLSR